MSDLVPISDIGVGERHRKDLGDIEALAQSIELEGLLQPIGITPDSELVFGERRLRAYELLDRDEIPARTVNVSSIVAGEWHENEVRKDFTASERVAIKRTIQKTIERRPGQRSDLGQNLGRGRVEDEAAKRAGFGNRETARQAEKVVDEGTPELVEAMDRGEVSISSAAEIAKLPKKEQAAQIKLPTKREALKISEETGNAVQARDGKIYQWSPPEQLRKADVWMSFESALIEMSDVAKQDTLEVADSVPRHMRDQVARDVSYLIAWATKFKTQLERTNVKVAS